MRRGLIVCAAAIAVGLLVTTAVYFWKAERSSSTSWLRSEFALDDQQARSVERIHQEYQAECALMCARIAETDEQLARLICDGQQVTPEIQNAIIETDRLRSECRVKMLEHFYRIAAELPEKRRTEYLRLVLPVVLRPGAMAQSHTQECFGSSEQIEYHLFPAASIMGSWLGLRKILTFSRCRGCARETIWPLTISWTAGKVD